MNAIEILALQQEVIVADIWPKLFESSIRSTPGSQLFIKFA